MTTVSLSENNLDIYPASHFKHEYSYLKSLFNEEVYELLEQSNAMLCGGAITSLMTGQEINDFDIYFRSREEMEIFLFKAMERVEPFFFPDGSFKVSVNLKDATGKVVSNEILQILGATDKSVMFSMKGKENHNILQVIAFDVFRDPSEVFSHFDYRINMGCFDFHSHEWKFDKGFLHDLAQRRLVFNEATNFPIISLLRMGKYQGRGYHISKKDVMSLGIKISSLELSSWEDAKRHLSGFYGTSVDELISKAGENDFSISGLIQCVNDAEDDYLDHVATAGYRKRPDFKQQSAYQVVSALRKTLGGGNLFKEVYLLCSDSKFAVFASEKDKYYITKKITAIDYNDDIYPSLECLEEDFSSLFERRKQDKIALKLSVDNPDALIFEGRKFVSQVVEDAGLTVVGVADFNLEAGKEKNVRDTYTDDLPF